MLIHVSLGDLIFQTGIMLARACEPFVKASLSASSSDLSIAASISLEKLISESQANKARLLHYYPLPPKASDGAADVPGLQEHDENGDGGVDDSLCGTHIDHSLLTGLCES